MNYVLVCGIVLNFRTKDRTGKEDPEDSGI
jgi:hypothetical protein